MWLSLCVCVPYACIPSSVFSKIPHWDVLDQCQGPVKCRGMAPLRTLGGVRKFGTTHARHLPSVRSWLPGAFSGGSPQRRPTRRCKTGLALPNMCRPFAGMDVRRAVRVPLIGLVERWLLRRRRCGGGLSRLPSTPRLDRSRVLRSLELLPPIVERRRGHGILALCLGCRESAVDVLHCSAAATDLGGQLSERARVPCAPRP